MCNSFKVPGTLALSVSESYPVGSPSYTYLSGVMLRRITFNLGAIDHILFTRANSEAVCVSRIFRNVAVGICHCTHPYFAGSKTMAIQQYFCIRYEHLVLGKRLGGIYLLVLYAHDKDILVGSVSHWLLCRLSFQANLK